MGPTSLVTASEGSYYFLVRCLTLHMPCRLIKMPSSSFCFILLLYVAKGIISQCRSEMIKRNYFSSKKMIKRNLPFELQKNTASAPWVFSLPTSQSKPSLIKVLPLLTDIATPRGKITPSEISRSFVRSYHFRLSGI